MGNLYIKIKNYEHIGFEITHVLKIMCDRLLDRHHSKSGLNVFLWTEHKTNDDMISELTHYQCKKLTISKKFIDSVE